MTSTRETACQKIADLVARFSEHAGHYKKGEYNETQTRRDYIDPFFKALGWDIDNEAGLAETYREVIHEDKVTIDGAVKAPDYCFTVYGQRKFFVEAKKPSVSVKDDISPAYQVRRYGWSAKLPISIITDFEEFSVYDCTKKPLPNDKPSTARIKYFTFQDYLREFDFFYDTFAKERILKGSFDKYVRQDADKKGTASVDKEFLKAMEGWRTGLAMNIALRNKDLSEEELNFAVQQTIDRLIFLRICEDRGIEPQGRLKSAVSGDSYYQNLFGHFHAADEKYNSGLFDLNKDRITKNLVIDNKTIKSIIQELYYPLSPYEFSVIPVEILGNAYEQFLGKVIRLTPGHQAKIEEKPEVRKAGGVYYTPQYIVEYIVNNTVGKLIEGKTPAEVSKIKILDPACGSGSFLLGAYQKLLDWHTAFYAGHIESGKSQKERPLTPEGRLTTAEKKRILLNNIYGVDVDSQAVEVTKLSLLLKAMEGETEASIKTQLQLFNDRILPTLDNNIRSGNSLVGNDFYDMNPHFDKGGQGGILGVEEKKIRPFDYQRTFHEVFKQGGFDVVIGNPPYVRQEMLGSLKAYFQKHYQVYHGIADLYAYFIERGISLLNSKGIFSYIVANKWMRANYGEPLRRWLKQQQLTAIIDFGDLPVFEQATTYPCILTVNKTGAKGRISISKIETLDFEDLEIYAAEHAFELDRTTLDDSGWSLANEKVQSLLDKLKSIGVPLGEYVQGKIYRGVLTGLNEAFVIDRETKDRLIAEDPKSAEVIKPFLAGRDIKRYQTPVVNKFLIFTRRGINIKQYSEIEAYLKQFRDRLTPKPKEYNGTDWKGRKPGSYKWYEIQDTVDYYEAFEKPKILYAEIATEGQFTISMDGSYSDTTTYIIPEPSKYLLALFNSKLWTFLFSKTSSEIRGGFFRWKKQYMAPLPIRHIDLTNPTDKVIHDEIVKLVDLILTLNRELQSATLPDRQEQIKNRIAYTDKKIDELVYKLYGLSEDEIRLVEGKS